MKHIIFLLLFCCGFLAETNCNTPLSLGDVSALGCTLILGNISISATVYEDLNFMENVTGITGFLEIVGNEWLIQVDGLAGLTVIGLFLRIRQNEMLTQIDGLGGLTDVGGFIEIRENERLSHINGLSGLNSVMGSLLIRTNINLALVDGLSNITKILGDVEITDNESLTQIDALSFLTFIGGHLYLETTSFNQIESLINLEQIKNEIIIDTIPMCSYQLIQHFETEFNVTISCSEIFCQDNTFGENCSQLCDCFQGGSTCDDGINGTGQCFCFDTFSGALCDICLENHFGYNCSLCTCVAGNCDDGLEGTGACFCQEGFSGRDCDILSTIEHITDAPPTGLSTDSERIFGTTINNDEEIEEDITVSTIINQNVKISIRNITIAGNLDIHGDLDIPSSIVIIKNSIRVNGTLSLGKSTLQFSDPSATLTASCVIFSEDTSIKTNLAKEDKKKYDKSNPLVLIRSGCVEGESFITNQQTSCDDQGFKEKYQYDNSELSVLFTSCSNNILIFGLVAIIIITVLLIIVITLYLTIPPFRKFISPFKRKQTNKKNRDNTRIQEKISQMDKEISAASNRVQSLQIELADLNT